jgi:hypothetical protein
MWHTGFDAGAAAFWIFIAAAVVMNRWSESRKDAEKHETLRRIFEKTGTVDEARLKELFNPTLLSQWQGGGDTYRGLRIGGTIVMFIAAGLATVFLILEQTGAVDHKSGVIGLAIASGIAMLGVGLFFASRFAPPPDKPGNEPRAR